MDSCGNAAGSRSLVSQRLCSRIAVSSSKWAAARSERSCASLRMKPLSSSSTDIFSAGDSRVSRSAVNPSSIHRAWFGPTGGPVIGTRTIQLCSSSTARKARAQASNAARHAPRVAGGVPVAWSTISASRSSLDWT
jgi:hypothetical protein